MVSVFSARFSLGSMYWFLFLITSLLFAESMPQCVKHCDRNFANEAALSRHRKTCSVLETVRRTSHELRRGRGRGIGGSVQTHLTESRRWRQLTTMQKRLRPDVVSGIQFYLSHNLLNLCNVPEVDPAFSVVALLESEPGDAANLDSDSMPTVFKLLPDYLAIPSAITGGPSIYSQAPPEMYLGPDILKVSTFVIIGTSGHILSTQSRCMKKFLRRKNAKGLRSSLFNAIERTRRHYLLLNLFLT
jgi:hypothetical protein